MRLRMPWSFTLFLAALLAVIAAIFGAAIATTSVSADQYRYDQPMRPVVALTEPNLAEASADELADAPAMSGALLAERSLIPSRSLHAGIATEAEGGARFVAGSDGIVDTVGAAPNAISLGKYPAYVNDGAATGARTFSISDEAWNAMTPAEQWVRNQQFLDQAIARGSGIPLASPPTPGNLTGWYAKELDYLSKQGYTISSDGARMIAPGG